VNRAKRSGTEIVAPGMRYRVLTMIALLMASLCACNSGPALSADQEQGKRIYESLCDKCHTLISPQAHSDREWDAAAERYGVMLKLQSKEVALLKAYLNRANDADFR